MLIAGDIGGTKTNIALYSGDSNPYEPIVEATFASKQYASLEEIVSEFLTQTGAEVTVGTFGVAGPVIQGSSAVTNLGWTVSETSLQDAFHLDSVRVVNDLVATASAIPVLEEDDLLTINEGKHIPKGPISVIAPGTGLGEAYMTWMGDRYYAHPSEGGHADFSPSNNLELGLLNYLYDIFGHVSTERVCSGSGIPNIYNYLKSIDFAKEPAWLKMQLAAAPDPTPIIVTTALEDPNKCPLCTETVNLFVSILGAEAGDLALTFMATGGVYLGGGIPPRIWPILQSDRFLDSFYDKGRFRKLMEQVPVYVILNTDAALLGAASLGLDLLVRTKI